MDALTLADVLRARAPLTDGEAATVAIPLADELAALHRRGLGYGPLTLDAIVVEPGGRPHLVPRAGRDGGADDDVAHLLRLVLSAMAPQVPDDDAGLRAVLEDLLATGCGSGQEVVDACFAVVEPEPLRLPDAGALARAHLLAQGAARLSRLPRAGAGRVSAGRLEGLRGRSRADDGARTPVAAPGRGQARRRARRRARLVRLGTAVAVVVVVGVVGTVLHPPVSGAAAVESPDAVAESPDAVEVDPVLDRDAPAAAAAALTRQRAAALAGGTAAALDGVDVVGGPAWADDVALLAAVGGGPLEGLSVDVQAVDVVTGPAADGAAADGVAADGAGLAAAETASAADESAADETAAAAGEVRVAVSSAMSPYRRVGESGTVDVTGTAPRTVVLHLRWTDDGWRVWSVESPGEQG